ncbi:MAG: hypothetical protein V7754_04705 [Halioglobus sp.]
MSSQNGFLTRKLLISLAIIAFGLFVVVKNQTADLSIWIAGALILGLLIGYVNRGPTLGVIEKIAATGIRYKSKWNFFGLPLVCIASGPNPEMHEDRGLAKGIIAIGDVSFGILSFGGLAFGVFSVGGASIGLVSVGGLAIGVLALGGAAIGLLAAVGGVAIGYNVVGEVGIGIQHFEDTKIHILDLLTL